MKKSGIINAELMKALTLARHGHMITICDAGFPIPKGEDIIDLSLTAGIPSFFDTLKAVLNEIIVEKAQFERFSALALEFVIKIR